MKHFTTFNFGRARNKEYLTSSRRIAGVVTQHGAATYHLSGMLQIVLDVNDSMRLKLVYNRKLEQTPAVIFSRSEIKRIMGAILAMVKAYKRCKIAAQTADLALVQVFLDKYSKSILGENEAGQVLQLDDIFLALEGDVALNEAILSLQLKTLFDELRENYNNLTENSDGRTKVASERKVDNFSALRNIGKTALRNLLLAIELGIVEHPELDYSLMVSNIDAIIIQLKSDVLSRSTRKSKKSDGTIAPDVAA
ncbi:MAG TPA: DUF6261 family protein [Paludibacter sp.]